MIKKIYKNNTTLTPLSPRMAATARSMPGESGLLNSSMLPLGLKSISRPSTSTTRVSVPKQVPEGKKRQTDKTDKRKHHHFVFSPKPKTSKTIVCVDFVFHVTRKRKNGLP